VRSPPSPHLFELHAKTKNPERIVLDTHDAPFEPRDMLAYLERGWRALVQPSRAEAFGIIPCEARCIGLPVIISDAAGHKEHILPGECVIPSYRSEPICVNGIPNGLAPTIDLASIRYALEKFMFSEPYYQTLVMKNRGYCQKKYDWKRILEPLAKELKNN
jgi:glycosyltransferase involved in cell wall biosynthesis